MYFMIFWDTFGLKKMSLFQVFRFYRSRSQSWSFVMSKQITQTIRASPLATGSVDLHEVHKHKESQARPVKNSKYACATVFHSRCVPLWRGSTYVCVQALTDAFAHVFHDQTLYFRIAERFFFSRLESTVKFKNHTPDTLCPTLTREASCFFFCLLWKSGSVEHVDKPVGKSKRERVCVLRNTLLFASLYSMFYSFIVHRSTYTKFFARRYI